MSAFSPLFHLIFSFLPLYLHASSQPFSSASPPPRLVFKPAPGRGLRPILMCGKGASTRCSFFQGERKDKRMVASRGIGLCLFGDFVPSSLRKNVRVLFSEERENQRIVAVEEYRHLLFRRLCFFFFFFIPFASAASSARKMGFGPLFFSSGGKGKPKEGSDGGSDRGSRWGK